MVRKRRSGKLYRGKGTKARQERAFKARYGKRGPEVYGKVLGKVAREQAAERGGIKIEQVKQHESKSKRGRKFQVRHHIARIRVGKRRTR